MAKTWQAALLVCALLFNITRAPLAHAQDAAIETAARAVVRILPQQCNAMSCQAAAVGSGVLIDASGVILTAWHVTVVEASADPVVQPHRYADDVRRSEAI